MDLVGLCQVTPRYTTPTNKQTTNNKQTPHTTSCCKYGCWRSKTAAFYFTNRCKMFISCSIDIHLSYKCCSHFFEYLYRWCLNGVGCCWLVVLLFADCRHNKTLSSTRKLSSEREKGQSSSRCSSV